MRLNKWLIALVIMVLAELIIFSPKPSHAREFETGTSDVILASKLKKNVDKLISSLTESPSMIQNDLLNGDLNEWRKHLKTVITGLIPRQHQVHNKNRDKKVYLVWYCLDPYGSLENKELKKLAIKATITVLKSDQLSNLAWDWLKPAITEGFLLLPRKNQGYILEYLAYTRKTLSDENFYTKEQQHWQACLNKKTNYYDWYYQLPNPDERFSQYLGTGAHAYIEVDPAGKPRGEFGKLDAWLFRRIHFDGIGSSQLNNWAKRLESALKDVR